jgi:outer membrane lipoprotein-sorting protein
MSVMASRPVLRWVVPAGVLVAVVGGGAITTALQATADVSLAPRSAAQLLVDVQTARLDGASGTVVERANLGLPSLPAGIGGEGSSQLNSLISGAHTLRVWYSGPDKTRVALLGGLGESDVIRNGHDVWIWSSRENSATHTKLPADEASRHPMADPSALPGTPQQAADQVLAAIEPSTKVIVEASDKVAGRGAYELALIPKDSASLIARVRIAIDGVKHVPTRVQVFAKGYPGEPAFEIGFTSVNFTRPDAGVFAFTPPKGAKIDDQTAPKPEEALADKPKTAVIGTGWTSVFVARLPQGEAGQGLSGLLGGATGTPGARGNGSGNGNQPNLGALLNNLPEVKGAWGSGRLISSRVFSVLLTDDGRVLFGLVSGDQLAKVAGDPAAALK